MPPSCRHTVFCVSVAGVTTTVTSPSTSVMATAASTPAAVATVNSFSAVRFASGFSVPDLHGFPSEHPCHRS